MNNHVFVSHSHDDSPAADLIVKALEERGVVCWVAPRDVPAGGSYAESIINAIESASCFVLIYSQSSNVSSHVMREVERALKFGVNIVPVRFDDSTPSKSLDYLLATVHWLAIAPDARERSIATAAEQILAAVAKSQNTRPAGEAEKVAPRLTAAAPVAPSAKSTFVLDRSRDRPRTDRRADRVFCFKEFVAYAKRAAESKHCGDGYHKD